MWSTLVNRKCGETDDSNLNNNNNNIPQAIKYLKKQKRGNRKSSMAQRGPPHLLHMQPKDPEVNTSTRGKHVYRILRNPSFNTFTSNEAHCPPPQGVTPHSSPSLHLLGRVTPLRIGIIITLILLT